LRGLVQGRKGNRGEHGAGGDQGVKLGHLLCSSEAARFDEEKVAGR
jgi:hypothetical protein